MTSMWLGIMAYQCAGFSANNPWSL